MGKLNKPKTKAWKDIILECQSWSYHNEDFTCVLLEANLYDSKDIVKVIAWLNKALLWKINQELK